MSLANQIALGTVQFGQVYGVANESGQVSLDEIASILEYAQTVGINTLDTAMAYGESEARLGEVGVDHWQVISKLLPIPDGCDDVSGFVQRAVFDSLKRLKRDSLHGLLLHAPDQLLGAQGDELYQAMIQLKQSRLVENIGISIYAPEELDVLCARYFFDLVQTPFNVLDRQIVSSGWLSYFLKTQTKVHARSVFLQGLLLMKNRPDQFNRWQLLWNAWEKWLDDAGVTSLQACLNFVLFQPGIDRAIVGIDNLNQLKEIVDSAKALSVLPPETLMSHDLNLINPRCWNLL